MRSLHYKKIGSGSPLLILHGLFGSLDNWLTIAKKLAAYEYEVWIIDQRNHGRSFHDPEHNYRVMAEDLLHFTEEHQLSEIILCGHSMGGKTAMAFSLRWPERVRKLIVCDISPAAFENRHHEVFDALNTIPCPMLHSREEAESILRNKGLDENTIPFLLKNLFRDEKGVFHWRFNLRTLEQQYDQIADEITGMPVFMPTLFIKGQLSGYINASNYPEIETLFPKHQLTEIPGAGHWVHADNPDLFLKTLIDFMQEKHP